MNGIVIIPCFDRPAFLQACINHILKADGAGEMRYIFALDYGYDVKNLPIIEAFPYDYAVLERKTKIVGVGKQSNNVLMGMKAGWEHCEGMPMYYIEDDVFIGKDFFTFGAAILQNEPDVLCAILSKNVNAVDNTVQDVNGYYVKQTNQYQGIGSVYNPAVFKKFVFPHICPEYVSNPRVYCATMFNASLGLEFCEQDGLFRRIIEVNKLRVAFSHVPRCFHAGFFGYHRMTAGHIRRLPIDRQVEKIYDIAFDIDKLRKIAAADNLVYDSMPVDLNTNFADCKLIPLK